MTVSISGASQAPRAAVDDRIVAAIAAALHVAVAHSGAPSPAMPSARSTAWHAAALRPELDAESLRALVRSGRSLRVDVP